MSNPKIDLTVKASMSPEELEWIVDAVQGKEGPRNRLGVDRAVNKSGFEGSTLWYKYFEK